MPMGSSLRGEFPGKENLSWNICFLFLCPSGAGWILQSVGAHQIHGGAQCLLGMASSRQLAMVVAALWKPVSG